MAGSGRWIRNLRLGLYTERLIGAWLRHSRRIRLLAQNWPLRASRITLGEADFLVERREAARSARQRRGALELWELACKFYLGVPGRGWIGPGLNDSLAAKLARMRGHQLQLIHQPGFRAAWDGDWSARAWLAGWLLSPAQVPEPAARPMDRQSGAFPRSGRKRATRRSPAHGKSAESLGVEQWWLLPKRRWLRPVHGDEPVAQIFDGLRRRRGIRHVRRRTRGSAGPSTPGR